MDWRLWKGQTEHRYDLIFMDVQMPKMDGTTAATHMRQAGVTVPVVAMTAHAMSEQVTAIRIPVSATY